jgi:4-amino-4-deoxy-L-arabinose transferase-like glycosyltransferase
LEFRVENYELRKSWDAGLKPAATLADPFRILGASLPVILVVAVLGRVGYAWLQMVRISPEVLRAVPFLYEPGNIGYSIALGHGFGSPFRAETGPTAWVAPVYPYIVAGFFKLFGTYDFRAFLGCIALNIFCSALACVPIYFAGKRVGGMRVGAGAAWLWAIFPNAIIIPFQWIWDTSISTLLAATILWATIELAESRRVRNWCAYGLLWGFTLMTNPTLSSLLPFLFGWLIYRAWKEQREWVRNVAISAAVIVACCLPWTIRNFLVFHAFAPTRTALGMQLWLGNNEHYSDRWAVWKDPLDNQDEREKYVAMGEIAYMAEKRDEAIEFMVTHPRREAHMIFRRFIATWTGSATPVADFFATPSWAIRGILVSNLLAGIGALAGIFVLWRRRNPFLFPVSVFVIIFPCVEYFTWALLRYRHPIDPIVMFLTAIAIAELLRRSAGTRSYS